MSKAPITDRCQEYNLVQRAVDLFSLLDCGRRLTTAQVAERYHVSRHTALRLLENMSAVAPLAKDDTRRWYSVAAAEKIRAQRQRQALLDQRAACKPR